MDNTQACLGSFYVFAKRDFFDTRVMIVFLYRRHSD